MQDCPNYAMDSHLYLAWNPPSTADGFLQSVCAVYGENQLMEQVYGKAVVVGEWSLATDNCAMWLNGFQDNMPGYPTLPCTNYVSCPAPYMGSEQPDAPPNPSWGPDITQDPHGTGESFVSYGMCPIDQILPMGLETGPGSNLNKFALAQLFSFDLSTHGNMFWNFRTELEPRWDYLVGRPKHL
jgi:glucan 1,3-beta-glucosidase